MRVEGVRGGLTLRATLTLVYAGFLTLSLVAFAVTVQGMMTRNMLASVHDQLTQVEKSVSLLWRSGKNPVASEGLAPGTVVQVDIYSLPLATVRGWSDATFEVPTWQVTSGQQSLHFGAAQAEALRTTASAFSTVKVGGVPYRVLSTLQERDGRAARVSVALPLVGVDQNLGQLRGVMSLVALWGLLVAFGVAYVVTGRILAPLRLVQAAAERISQDNLSERVPEARGEVGELAGAFNAMLDRVQRLVEAQRRFTSDASHELRTPVTSIAGHAGFLLRRTQLEPQQRESLLTIQREAERLGRLVQDLLELARQDAGTLTVRAEPVPLRWLAEDVAHGLRGVTRAALTVRGDDVWALVDKDRIHQVLLNLVMNADKAGARAVTVTVTGAGTQVQVSVTDDGEGISPEHLPRIFDRFYRVEDSRQRGEGGTGLGLSIARAIVAAHGGTMELSSVLGAGTAVSVLLPSSDAPDDDLA